MCAVALLFLDGVANLGFLMFLEYTCVCVDAGGCRRLFNGFRDIRVGGALEFPTTKVLPSYPHTDLVEFLNWISIIYLKRQLGAMSFSGCVSIQLVAQATPLPSVA